MLRFLKHLVVVFLIILFAGCSGGGCSSGCSCAGVTPLAEGFNPARRIENSASLRLTDSGVTFLEANLSSLATVLVGGMGMNGIVNFEVPTSMGSLGPVDYTACTNGPNPNSMPPECIAEIDLGNAQLDIAPTAPHNILVTGPLPLRLQSLPMHITYFCIGPICVEDDIEIKLNGMGSCSDNSFANIDLNVDVDISIDSDTNHSRYGYSKIDVNIGVDSNQLQSAIAVCGGFSASILSFLLQIAGGLITDPLINTLNSQVEDQLCQKANPALSPTCPNGTTDVNGVCRYGTTDSDPCASIILGMDGNIDLGGLLASFSPGTKGAFDFLFAAGGHSMRTDGSGFHYGDLNPIGSGVTLGMYGGAEPTDPSGCVPPVDVRLPTAIPIPDELLANTIAGWPAMMEGPHFGFALSERFTNYLLAQAYNSGALCLGITGDALGDSVPLGTSIVGVGLGASSMVELGRMKEPAAIAIAVRPQQPPTITFGNGTDINTDPLIRILLPQASFDFYAWSLDRYIRVMTATMDLDVPLNLESTPEGLLPVLEEVGVSNAVVTNSKLLREDPATIAAALQGLLGSLVGSALGSALPPININDQLVSLGITLDIPPTVAGQGSPGLRLLTKDSDDFLGIFATLGVAPAMAAMATGPDGGQHDQWGGRTEVTDTEAELIGLEVDPAGLEIATYQQDNGPRASLYLSSLLDDGTRAIEWQYKLDKGAWHPFTTRRHLTIEDDWLRTQGRHTVYVRSRVAGDVYSLDPTPAEVTVRVDIEPPRVLVRQQSDGSVVVEAWDAVSRDKDTDVRVRFGHGEAASIAWQSWSAWMSAAEIAPLWPEDADFIEVEAADEEGLVGQARQAIIRGRSTGATSGCNCRLADAASQRRATPAWMLALVLAGLAIWRRRRSVRAACHGARAGVAAKRAIAAAALVLAGGLSGCSCGDTTVDDCRHRGDCTTISPGLIGAYTSAATAPDGTIWVAGYLEANHAQGYFFGDLVVGPLSGGDVKWQVIDGLPAGAIVDPNIFDPKGFRGGNTDAGDDVGLWTSIAIDDSGSPGVAYFDATHRALRYAHMSGGAWSVTIVQQVENADVGRYAKLLYVNGQPVIAYLFIEPSDGGAVKSGVRIATGSSADSASAQWGFEEVDSNPATPCRAYNCASGFACVASTGVCARKTNDCAADCAALECVELAGMSQCEAVMSTGRLETYPEGVGLYVSTAKRPGGGLGIAYYDRVRGNLKVASNAGSGWTAVLVDGEDAMGNDTGDKGIGASLAIDPSDVFHVSYVDGLNETLNYVAVAGGTMPGVPEAADDGIVPGDGQHIVGDDSNIFVTAGGEVRISYQDATSGELRLAVGAPSGNTHMWQVQTTQQDGFAGAFSRQIDVGGSLQVLNWWRVATPAAEGNVRVVTP